MKQVSRYIKEKKSQGENLRIIRQPSDQQNTDFWKAPDNFIIQKAKIVESLDKKISAKPVQIKTELSKFSYFLDGIERKRVLFNYNHIPVTYGYIAAAILKRTNKKMHSTKLETSVESLYLPIKEESDAPEFYFNAKDFAQYGFMPVNIGTKDKKTGKYPHFPIEFEQKARSDIQDKRNKMEKGLAKQWLSNNADDGWLYIDGRLENKNDELVNAVNMAGIIKSHHVIYFDYEEQNTVYNLKKGERTTVFQPVDKEEKEENVFTWYLRLHDNPHNGKVDFGIVRVEISATEAMLKRADEISSWILLETRPVAFSASRWDRMIYPIQYCEDFLKSKAPSWTMIESL